MTDEELAELEDSLDHVPRLPSIISGRVYPCTITGARYSGVYSGALWHAWGLHPAQVPDLAYGSDPNCGGFWASVLAEGNDVTAQAEHFAGVEEGFGEYWWVLGRGRTPDDAYSELFDRVWAYQK